MNNKYKNLLYSLTTALCLCGCGGKATGTDNQAALSADSRTITYYTWQDEQAYAEKLVAAFSVKYPQIHVDIHYISDSLTETELEELVETQAVDVIGIKNINHVLSLSEHGKLTDITKRIASGNIDVSHYGNMYNSVSFQGAYYCLPFRKTSWALIYNKDIFDAEGLAYPEQMTWEEYAALAKRLTHGSGTDKQWGGYFPDWVYNFMGIQMQNYLYDDDLTYTEQSLAFLNKLYNEDLSHMTPGEMKKEHWLKTFERGNIAMMPLGEWFVGMILADEKAGVCNLAWDIAPIPVVKNQKAGITWGQYQLASITSKCKTPDTAFLFLEFLCGPEGAGIYAANGMIPAYIDDDIRLVYEETVANRHTSVFFESFQIQEQPACLGYDSLKEMLETEAVAYLSGEQTLQDAMAHYAHKRAAYYETQ